MSKNSVLLKIPRSSEPPEDLKIVYRAGDYVLSSAAAYAGDYTGIPDRIVLNDWLE